MFTKNNPIDVNAGITRIIGGSIHARTECQSHEIPDNTAFAADN